LAQLVKLLSCDWKVTDSSLANDLLCKKQSKVAYNTPNDGTPSRTLRMQELWCTGLPFIGTKKILHNWKPYTWTKYGYRCGRFHSKCCRPTKL